MIKKNGVKNEKDKEYNKINMNVLCNEVVDSIKNDIERWNTYNLDHSYRAGFITFIYLRKYFLNKI